MKRMRLLSSLARHSAVDRVPCVAQACSSLQTAPNHIHQGARPIAISSGQLPAFWQSAQRTRRCQSHLPRPFWQPASSTMADATHDLAQRDMCNGGASDSSHASPPTLDSDFLLRHNAGSAPQDTVVVVLNWNLPACTPRLLSAGGLGSTVALWAATHAQARQHAALELSFTAGHCTCAARMCVCADGGANQLYDEMPKRLPAAEPDAVRVQYAPDAITGRRPSLQAGRPGFPDTRL
jgi:hypothetical protein